MKQFSLVLNVILLLAVAFLYYLYFTGSKKGKHNNVIARSNTLKDSCTFNSPVIAYVELDSLNNNVSFIKDRKKELELEQKSITTEYENAYRALEGEKNNFLKKGNAITQ